MQYTNIKLAYFLERPNRFIAHCRLVTTDETVIAHVKNTGRCKEILLPEALVALNYQPSAKRKTDYDLIAVKKGEMWINIDSQIPNILAANGLLQGTITLPHLKGKISFLKREYMYGHSKFDIYFETNQGEKGFVEVKGMTLENHGIGAFPDAPTIRGKKHVLGLAEAAVSGYKSYLLFIVQFPKIKAATIHQVMQPDFFQAVAQAEQDGVTILAYNCEVDESTIDLVGQVPFNLTQSFIDPNL
ncbi:DNA/RNA nuclease SfsA [Enterococcus pallens]|uniref:Sugar fermentation stimulation protein homolog n=1 Tax=Enterococcus pallens ATCC BAA-351 TaxID=1158607 RepID=R2SHZ1_9ENTE|nr:DNA/RNA nuclease SfsA [Enterococcus pallens]EOH87814.1 sugar fermentation stimulation protein [Enterococcus pallens ATCC BAA-351]EOU18028.1 sugar fermentation stimulation protein [Enterococcus pallens ATCC BAA-351]OJG82348.1 sugar fermentation stimulation protein [Enterococcus pallens]